MTDTANAPRLACNEMVELVTSYLDDTMTEDTRARFEVHLETCRGCRNYLEQFRATIGILGHLEEHHLDPAFRDRLLDALRDWRGS